jgi:hypothetical protein
LRQDPVPKFAPQLEKSLTGKVKSNKNERRHVLEVLGYVGVLCPADRPSCRDRYIGYEERQRLQPKHFGARDWEYPAQHWSGHVGLHRDIAAEVFGIGG